MSIEAMKQDGWVLREVLFDDGEPIAHREPAQPALVPWSQALESVWAEDDTTLPAQPAQRQPLTEERLLEILRSVDADTKRLPPGVKAFARGVEAAHGIKEKNHD